MSNGSAIDSRVPWHAHELFQGLDALVLEQYVSSYKIDRREKPKAQAQKSLIITCRATCIEILRCLNQKRRPTVPITLRGAAIKQSPRARQ